jgi:two-component system LytT family response regulator
MKVIIIEDETAAVRNLKAILQAVSPQTETVAVLDSVKKSVEWLSANPSPDLIFMDIHLSDGSSFLIFDKIRVDTPVIFTTAYDEYALEAFKVNSIGYLLKPLKQEDVSRAIAKFEKLTGSDKSEYLLKLARAVRNENYIKSLLIPQKDKFILLPVEKVLCFYSREEKVTAYTADNKLVTSEKSLDALMEKLNPRLFFRANRQFIIARSAVKDVSVWEGNRLSVNLISEADEPVIVSKAHVPELKKWLIRN